MSISQNAQILTENAHAYVYIDHAIVMRDASISIAPTAPRIYGNPCTFPFATKKIKVNRMLLSTATSIVVFIIREKRTMSAHGSLSQCRVDDSLYFVIHQ